MKMLRSFKFRAALAATVACAPGATLAAEGIILDAVVAAVDGVPITLNELGAALVPPRALTLDAAAADPQVQAKLNELIQNRILRSEAAARRLGVSPEEVQQYIQEVARRNQITVEELPAILKNEGRSLADYKKQIEIDILKTKVAGALMRGGISVSESEVDKHLAENPGILYPGAALRLREILVSPVFHSEEEMKARIEAIEEAFDDEEEFTDIVVKYSDGDTADGGALEPLAADEISPKIAETVLSLDIGEVSGPVVMEDGVRFFKLEERIGGESVDKNKIRAEIREQLKAAKTQSQMASFVSDEITARHSVDKKI